MVRRTKLNGGLALASASGSRHSYGLHLIPGPAGTSDRSAAMPADVGRLSEAIRAIDSRLERERSHRANTRNAHEPHAELVVLNRPQQRPVELGQLLAKHFTSAE